MTDQQEQLVNEIYNFIQENQDDDFCKQKLAAKFMCSEDDALSLIIAWACGGRSAIFDRLRKLYSTQKEAPL